MKKKPGWFSQFENEANTMTGVLSKHLWHAKKIAGKIAKETDEAFSISETTKSTVEKIKSNAYEIDEKHRIKENLSWASDKAVESLGKIKSSETLERVEAKITNAKLFVKNELIDPTAGYLERARLVEGANIVGDISMSTYGKTRAILKPYFASSTPRDLLTSTKQELLYINACILQVNRDQAEAVANRLGAAISAKMAGAVTVGGLLGLVSAFGSAGTGTAIATLSGTAANGATLAWVGSLLGGGMAAGAAMTGGLALAVSIGVYKVIGSEARKFEDLSDVERRIVEATGFLIAAINEVLEEPEKGLGMQEAELLLENTLKPLYISLQKNAEDIAKNLDIKNRVAFKQHVLVDFERQVIDGFEFFIAEQTQTRRELYPEYAITGVIYALLSETAIDDSMESQLALKAIRRVRNDWNEIAEAEISSVLSQFDPEQIRGLANNAKGIYHEMLFVDNYNKVHDDTYAEMYEATNYPGSDVMIRSSDTNEVLAEYQLKASSSDQIIKEHFEKYPDIDVLATEEIALKTSGVDSSGISNEEISNNMDDVIADVANNTFTDRVGESVFINGLAAAGLESIQVLSGKKSSSEAGINILKFTGVAATSTALVAYLFV